MKIRINAFFLLAILSSCLASIVSAAEAVVSQQGAATLPTVIMPTRVLPKFQAQIGLIVNEFNLANIVGIDSSIKPANASVRNSVLTVLSEQKLIPVTTEGIGTSASVSDNVRLQIQYTLQQFGLTSSATGTNGSGTATSGDVLTADGSGGALYVKPTVAFDNISTGTNLSATMTVSSGATLAPAGSGVIKANAVDLVTTTITGSLPIANGGTNSSTTLINNQMMVSSSGKISELGTMSDGQVVVGKTGGTPQIVSVSGDATLTNTGTVIVTKANGVSFAASATTDATHATNIISGILPAARIGATSLDLTTKVTGVLPPTNGGTGSSTVPAAGKIPVGNVGGTAFDPVTLSADATLSSTGALTITPNAITNAKAAQMAANTLKGNNTGSTANAADLTATQATALLNAVVGDSGSGGTKGLVPAPATGDAAASRFLKADGTWSGLLGSGLTTAAAPLVLTTGNVSLGTAAVPDTADATADVIWKSSAAAKKPMVLQGSASQTAPLFQVQRSDGTVLYAINGGSATASGSDNLFVGINAGAASTTASYNTAFGSLALQANTGGDYCTAIGYAALTSNNGGLANTSVGDFSMYMNVSGGENTALGDSALFANTASNNTAVGAEALTPNTTGTRNVAVGAYSAHTSLAADDITAIGFQAAHDSLVSITAVGSNALAASTGAGNTAMGVNAGLSTITGSSNIIIGSNSAASSASASNEFVAGSSTAPANNAYFGKGARAAVPTPYTINGTGSSVNSTAGGDIQIAGGVANQASDAGGSIAFQTAATGSGTSLSTKVKINASGITNLFNGASVASAATITPTGNLFHVTGTTGITAISTTSLTAGTTITIIFDGVVTISGVNLKLSGGTFTSAANATLTLVWDGSNWFETARSINN